MPRPIRKHPRPKPKKPKPKPRHKSKHGHKSDHKSKPTLVCVEWEDHCTRSGWCDEEAVPNVPMLVQSAGILVKEDSECIQLTHAKAFFPGQVSDVDSPMTIIKSCIRRRRNVPWPFV